MGNPHPILASQNLPPKRRGQNRLRSSQVTLKKLHTGSIIVLSSSQRHDLLRIAASLEKGSEHPFASAILKGASFEGLGEIPELAHFESISGMGVIGQVDGAQAAIGNQKLMDRVGIDTSELSPQADSLRRDGQTVMYVSSSGKLVGILGIADPIKSTTAEAIELLKADKIRIVMLTGDNIATASAVAARLKIDEIRADILPNQKAAIIRELQAQGRFVAMAGDGVNDAPSLAQAQVGIAMGSGVRQEARKEQVICRNHHSKVSNGDEVVANGRRVIQPISWRMTSRQAGTKR